MLRSLAAALLATAAWQGAPAQPAEPRSFKGICDASAAEALNEDLVAVADDEKNTIRIYSVKRGGAPVAGRDFSRFLQVKPTDETDLEGAARIGDRIYWISSHGRNAKGKPSPSRAQFFATTATETNGVIQFDPVGHPYHNLVNDLLREPALAGFGLARGSTLAPKIEGAFNIEGLTDTPEGQLLIGFRNPIPGGKALLVPLRNPAEVVQLKKPLFGAPMLLDLHGRGIRSMARVQDRYLIIAGRYDEGKGSHLWEWEGGSEAPTRIHGISFAGFNPEALAVLSQATNGTSLFFTSDDGTRNVDGTPCKKLKSPEEKFFRGFTVRLERAPQ